jgi:hypothetical protein
MKNAIDDADNTKINKASTFVETLITEGKAIESIYDIVQGLSQEQLVDIYSEMQVPGVIPSIAYASLGEAMRHEEDEEYDSSQIIHDVMVRDVMSQLLANELELPEYFIWGFRFDLSI